MNPSSKRVAMPHVARPPPPKKKKNSCPPPLTNPAYAHELLLRNLFENPPMQTVIVYSTLYMYVYALQNLFRGQKMTKIVAQHILKCITWALFLNTMCPQHQCLGKLMGEQHYKRVSGKIHVYL